MKIQNDDSLLMSAERLLIKDKETAPSTMSSFIVTFTPHFEEEVFRELSQIDPQVKRVNAFGGGRTLIFSELEMEMFTQRIVNQSPIFVKHIMPVMEQGKIVNNLESDKSEILSAVDRIASSMNQEKFAVQCRVISGGESGLSYTSKDIEVYVGEEYFKRGNTPSFSDNEILNDDIRIISILINKDGYYIGYSKSHENLNFHCDEHRICSTSRREISRAENKLKEALVKFNIVLDGNGIALDIGAAPGGWTKVLADHGYEVIAVDPGDLHPTLQKNPKVRHFRERIEKLDLKDHFDVIVNDMNIDPQDTSTIMVNLAPTLKSGGMAVVTLKLPKKANVSIEESARILNQAYDILGIKSLFHNRQEVTVVLRKR